MITPIYLYLHWYWSTNRLEPNGPQSNPLNSQSQRFTLSITLSIFVHRKIKLFFFERCHPQIIRIERNLPKKTLNRKHCSQIHLIKLIINVWVGRCFCLQSKSSFIIIMTATMKVIKTIIIVVMMMMVDISLWFMIISGWNEYNVRFWRIYYKWKKKTYVFWNIQSLPLPPLLLRTSFHLSISW